MASYRQLLSHKNTMQKRWPLKTRWTPCLPTDLTSLNLHLDTVAAQAIDLLLEHLRGDTSRREADCPAAELIARESTLRWQRLPDAG